MSKTTPRPRRWRRRLLSLVALVVILVIVVVALAPTLVSMGIGRGAIVNAIDEQVNGTASLSDLSLGWFGGQSVKGLSIKGDDGRTNATVDLACDRGLFDIITGGLGGTTIAVSGDIEGAIREDGSLSFADLVAKKPSSSRSSGKKAKKKSGGPPPAVTIRLDDVDVTVEADRADRTFAARGLSGTATIGDDGAVTADVRGELAVDDATGTIALAANIANPFDERGKLALAGRSGEVTVDLGALAVAVGERRADVDTAQVAISADDLTGTIALRAGLDGRIDGADRSNLDVQLDLDGMVASDGTFTFDIARITGTAIGESVPAALLDPLTTGTPIALSRDLGETFDVEVRFRPEGSDDIAVTVDGERLDLGARGRLDPADGSIAGDSLTVDGTLDPRLLTALTGLPIEGTPTLDVDIDHFNVPGADADGNRPLGAYGATGSFAVSTAGDPVSIALDDERRVNLRSVSATFDAPSLAKPITIAGGAVLDEARIDADLSIEDLLDEKSQPSNAMRTVGTVTVEDLVPSRFVSRDTLPAIAQPLLDEALTIRLTGRPIANGVDGDVSVEGDSVNLEATMTKTASSLAVHGSKLSVTVPAGELAAASDEETEPLQLVAPATITIELDPFAIAIDALIDGRLPASAEGRVTSGPVRLAGVAGLEEAVGIDGLDAAMTLTGGAEHGVDLGIDGVATLVRAATEEPISRMALAVDGGWRGDSLTDMTVNATLDEVRIDRLERLFGRPEGTWSMWAGTGGVVTASATQTGGQYRALVDLGLERLRGKVDATLADDTLSLTSEQIAIDLSTTALEKILLHAPEMPDAAADPTTPPSPPGERPRVESDVTLTAVVEQLTLPLAVARGEPFTPADAALRVEARAATLALTAPGTGRSTLGDLAVSASSEDFASGISFTANATATGPRGEAGTFTAGGTVTNLVDDQSVFRSENARLTMQGNAKAFPTSLADALRNLGGFLVAAVGPTADVTIETNDLSASTGTIAADFTSPQSALRFPRLASKPGILRIPVEPVATGELTLSEPLRQKLLSSIHPIFRDVKSMDGPMRMTASRTVIPTDGNIARMRADVEINVGRVQLDSGSLLFALLAHSRGAQAGTIEGEFEPIIIKIRNGVLTYDQFAVRVDKQTMRYQGTVDLVQDRIDLRTEVPLDALAMAVKEVRDYADKIVVPIVTRGTIDDHKTEIDPSFDVGAVLLDAGFRGALDELLGDQLKEGDGGGKEKSGDPLGNLLDGLLGGEKDEDEKDEKPKKKNNNKKNKNKKNGSG